MARFHADDARSRGRDIDPAIKTSCDIDFFRIEPGDKWVPCVVDDRDLWDQRPKVLKAFFDTLQVQAMAYVRWGAARFDVG